MTKPESEPASEPAERGAASAPPLPPGPPTTRVDRWLWAVRLLKTRSDAADACRGGHVRVNDRTAKPATPVSVGDTVRVRVNGRTRIVVVDHVIAKRVGAPVAARCYIDHSPAPTPESVAPVPRRDRGAGRPTKRDRRMIERLRGHS